MTRVHTPNIAVLAVVLAVLTMVVAPVPVAATGGDTTSGTTIGDHLGDAGDSSDDSTDGEDSSTDSSTTDSDDSTTDDGGTSDSSGDTDDGSGDGSTAESDGDSTSDSMTSDSDDSSSDGSSSDDSDDSSTDDSQEQLETATTNVSGVSDDVALPDGVTSDLSDSVDVADIGGDGTDSSGVETPGDTTTNPTLDATTLDAGTFATAGVTSTTADVTDTVDGSTDTLVEETTVVLSAVDDPTVIDTTSPTRTQLDQTRLESVPAATQSFAAPRSNALTVGGATGSSTPQPPAPATGLALGAGALAAAVVTRNGAAAPTLLTGLGSTLGSALTAGLAPIAGRAGMLDRLFRMLAPFRYSRYDDSDPLEHDARSDVYDVVNDAPGAYLSEVAEEADLPLSTARHHIRVLEREDLVSGAKVRGKRRFYPAYTQGIELAAALNDEATAAVIDAVARFGAASVSDLANELGRDPSTVSHHLKRLAEDDIIVRERDGRAVMNKLSAEARTALEPGHDTPVTEAGEALASD